MKTAFFTLLIFLVSISSSLAKNYPITEVTVYRTGATITRAGDLQLKKGDNTIELLGLSNNFDVSNAQIIIDPSVKVLSIRSEQDNFINLDHNKLNVLQDSLSWLDTEEALLRSQLATLEKNTKLSQSITGQYSQELEALMKYYKAETTKINQELFGLLNTKKVISTEMRLLQSQGLRSSGDDLVYQKKLIIKVNSSEGFNTDFAFTYFDNAAGWQTEYDLYMYGLDKDLSLIYKGKVYNNTNEDWTDVKLSLTTAKPNQNITVPQLSSWWLKEQNPIAVRGARKDNYYVDGIRVSTNVRQKANVMEEELSYDANYEAPAAYSEQFTASVFEVNEKHTIAKNTPDYTIILTEQNISAKYFYRCTPKLSNYAYLYARVENADDLILSQGNLTVFAQGRMQGKTYIDPSADTEKFEIPLGVDYGIAVERKKINDFADIKFFKSRVKKQVGFQMEIKNNKTASIEMELKDHVPLTTIDLIKVADLELDGGSLNEETGEITWTLSIDKNKRASKNLRYTVEYPKGMNIGI